MPDSDHPSIAIVMPAYNAVNEVELTIPAALASLAEAGGGELVVVDPASTDGTGDAAERLGANRVIRLPERAGPAHARNVGVETLNVDIVLFIDSDCVAKLDVARRVQAAFAEDPNLISITGSYCEDPPHRGFASLYMNLRHHFTHQNAQKEGASFWAGLGAMRRSVYVDVGGFDAVQFPMPMIEDIELALRIKGRGRTALDPTLQVTHLKRWTIGSVIKTDIFSRAIPWSKLIAASGEMPNDLNLRTAQRVAAGIAPLALLGVITLPFAMIYSLQVIGIIAAALIILSIILNAPMIAFFSKAAGPLFAPFGWLFHQLHLSYSAVVFALISLSARMRG
ncbi:MAG: GT2 family glycosyltransferase [Planctomycetota bacterium]|jgi:GT2 family glycosyltransferase